MDSREDEEKYKKDTGGFLAACIFVFAVIPLAFLVGIASCMSGPIDTSNDNTWLVKPFKTLWLGVKISIPLYLVTLASVWWSRRSGLDKMVHRNEARIARREAEERASAAAAQERAEVAKREAARIAEEQARRVAERAKPRPCNECGHLVSPQATECPKCGKWPLNNCAACGKPVYAENAADPRRAGPGYRQNPQYSFHLSCLEQILGVPKCTVCGAAIPRILTGTLPTRPPLFSGQCGCQNCGDPCQVVGECRACGQTVFKDDNSEDPGTNSDNRYLRHLECFRVGTSSELRELT